MHVSFNIDAKDIMGFLIHWSQKYQYAEEYKYINNIGLPLTRKSLDELFQWKNGTGSKMAPGKLKSVEDNYPLIYEGDVRSRYLNHKQPGGAIWNIFFLHCLEPLKWPIFDQHTFRAMSYLQTGVIVEIGSTSKKKYQQYETQYIPFVNALRCVVDDSRQIDKALFAFGKFLKMAKKYT